MFSVSVVIPTYNGRDLLLKNLPSVFSALNSLSSPYEVIVVDDASQDDTITVLADQFPSVRVFQNQLNQGFAETINRGIFAAQYDIVLALNNDVWIDSDLFDKILPHFKKDDIFAVTPKVLDPETKQQQAIFKLIPGVCWFRDTSLPEPPQQDEILLFFASGGSSCYHREKLIQIGGFSTLYAPFYVEDVDLSYQAWKQGWKSVMEPGTTAWHPVNTTIKKYHKRSKIKYLVARNKHIFMWVNITDRWLIIRYFICLIPSLIWDLLSFRKYKFIGMFMALHHISDILRERLRRKSLLIQHDRTIIETIRLNILGK